MKNKIKIAAFGALNQGSYEMFRECLAKAMPGAALACAGPYPNAEAVSVPGRPLRAAALKDPALKEDLFAAVAADARALGPGFDIYCMPCMSMIGFHDGVQEKLGQPILSLADALQEYYRDVDRVGVIHMPPAKARIAEIFGDRAVTQNEEQAARLAAVEGNAAAVEDVMKDIVEYFRGLGIVHILFARADAPAAQKSPAGKIAGVKISSYFDVLTAAIVKKGKSHG